MATKSATPAKPAVKNLFAAAKAGATTETTTGSKKSSMPVVEVSKKESKDFGTTLVAWTEKKQELAKVTADLANLDAVVRGMGQAKWLEMYKKNGKRTDSLKLTAEGFDAVATFISADAYTKVTADKATTLRSIYGDDVVTEKEEYKFDADMLSKYGEEISNLIMNSKKIANEDKANIIKCTTAFSVTKGTIDEMQTLAVQTKRSLDQVVADFGPTFQVKNA